MSIAAKIGCAAQTLHERVKKAEVATQLKALERENRELRQANEILPMTSLVKQVRYKPDTVDPRLVDLLSRKPVRVATVAMANKTVRIVWAIMVRGESYWAGHVPVLAA